MRDYQIKIEPFEYVAIQELKITQTINEHAGAEFVMRIRDGLAEQYM